MRTSRIGWLSAIVVIMAACFVVPFTLLRDVDAWYGSFLFWVIAAVAVIGINVAVSADWED